jgi:regulator of sigma E protease
MLGGVMVNFILAFVIYIGMAYTYGEMYIANANIKEGYLIENKVMLAAGFKTGDKIIAVDGEKIERFDNSINAKIVMGKEVLIERSGTEQLIKMPNDFIDQLSKQAKVPLIGLRMPFAIGKVASESVNQALKPKDIVIALNGQKIKYFDEVKSIIQSNKGKSIIATILRDEKEIQIPVIISKEGKLGVLPGVLGMELLEKLGYYKVSNQEFSFLESFPRGIEKGKDQLVGYGKQLKMIFSPSTGAYKQVGGFAAIFNIFPSTWSWEVFWNITALLSIMLGVMNLLPIPALDGGHVLFLLYEMISGKKPSDKFLENAQMVGFILLITLLLFANGNDIYKAIVGK